MTMLEAPAIRFEDVLVFNERLVGIAKAGVPVLFEHNPNDLEGSLQRINSQIAVRAGRGEAIEAILKTESDCSPEYRDALHAWVLLQGSMLAAEPLVAAGRWRQGTMSKFHASLCKLWIVWMMASISLLFMIWNLTPKLMGVYDVSHLTYRPGMHFLILIYSQLRWWVALTVVISVAIPFLVRWQSRRARLFWLPMRSKLFRMLRRSQAAETASQVALDTGEDASVAISEEKSSPLMEWAMQSAETERAGASSSQADSLQLVSEIYRAESKRTQKLSQGWVPGSIGMLVAALIVLGLGLALFAPMVELLIALCEPARWTHE
jgi:hypothetical protein